MEHIPESELIEQLRQGVQEGYRTLYRKYYMRVLLFVKGFVKSVSLSEDIAQNVFMKLWVMRETLYGISLNNLLFTIARNEVKDYFKSRYFTRRDAYDDQLAMLQQNEEITEAIQAREMGEAIAKAIDHLSSRRREIFTLSREQNLTNKEIAELLGISVRTVEKSIEMALRSIRNDIARIN